MKAFAIYALLVLACIGMAVAVINAASMDMPRFPHVQTGAKYIGQFDDSVGVDSVTAAAWSARVADTTETIIAGTAYSKGRLVIGAKGDTFHTYVQYSYDGATWTTKDTVKTAQTSRTAFTVVLDSTYTPLTGFKLGKVYPYYRVIFKQGTTGHHGNNHVRTTYAGKVHNWIIRWIGWD